MTLSAATLSSELQAAIPSADAAVAAQNFATAYGNYMKEAKAGAISILAAPIDSTAVPAMKAALTFTPGGGGAALIVAGMAAFWDTILAAPATFFPGSIAPATKPTFSSVQSIFDDNTDLARTLVAATAALGSAWHTQSIAGGSVTVGVSVVPIT